MTPFSQSDGGQTATDCGERQARGSWRSLDLGSPEWEPSPESYRTDSEAEARMHEEPAVCPTQHTGSHMSCRVKGPRRARLQAG